MKRKTKEEIWYSNLWIKLSKKDMNEKKKHKGEFKGEDIVYIGENKLLKFYKVVKGKELYEILAKVK